MSQFYWADKGAHFHRCDFQVHTPRDEVWKGPVASTDEERQRYAHDFVAACRRKGLHAVAITDHHDMLFVPFIRHAAQHEVDPAGERYPADQRLVVFPGIELTLALSRQALLLLDADFPNERFADVLQALAITPHDSESPTLPPVSALEHVQSLAELHKVLNQRDWLRERYIVLPNVTDKGHKSIMRKGMQAEYKEMPCVGGYLDGSVEKTGTGNARILAGEDPAWGNKALAVFQTSDCRESTFGDLGKHSTWVKWAQPTAEALRQACLGQQSRISQVQPELPTIYISRLSVSNSKFFGPLDLDFNTQYNAVIGGRGTGKSTILDYLRWGLCDQAAQVEDEDLANPSMRRQRLIDGTLRTVGGQVEVCFSINEITHVVRRDAATGDILLKVGSEDFTKVREEDVRALLPVHAYSQKQLSSVALRIDELTRFITAPIRRPLDALDEKITEAAGQFRENYARVRRARDLEASAERQRLVVQSLAEQAANLRGLLTDLSEQDRAVLDNKPRIDRVREAEASAEQNLSDVKSAGDDLLESITSAMGELQTGLDVPEPIRPLVTAARDERLGILSTLREAITASLSAFDQARAADGSATIAAEALNAAIAQFDIGYEDVKQRSTAHQARLNELAQVERRREAAAELLAQHQRDRRALGNPQLIHDQLRQRLIGLYRERSQLLADECERVTTLSGGLLRATMRPGRSLAAVEHKFRGLLQGSGVRGMRVEDLFANLAAESDPLMAWESVLAELEIISQLDADAELTSETTPILSRLEFPVSSQQRLYGRISADGWLDLALTRIDDEPLFEYQSRERDFIAFSDASAGQQATALLRILLAQSGMPLIIDQPEEDLDSQVVLDVVSWIWAAKKNRQLIFASHNANLVVNGDAELVVVCDYRRAGDQSGGKISQLGAIDIPVVRTEITTVMEGGEKAFRLRKERYGF